MAKKDTDKQVTGYLSPEIAEDVQKFLNEKNMSMSQGISKAFSLLLLDSMREKVPDQGAVIDEFMAYSSKMTDLFKASLERSLMADERARRDVRSQLEGVAALAEANKSLKADCAELKECCTKYEDKISEMQEKISQQQSTIASMKQEKQSLEEARLQIAELREKYNSEVAAHNRDNAEYIEKISSLQNELYGKLIETMKTAVNK